MNVRGYFKKGCSSSAATKLKVTWYLLHLVLGTTCTWYNTKVLRVRLRSSGSRGTGCLCVYYCCRRAYLVHIAQGPPSGLRLTQRPRGFRKS